MLSPYTPHSGVPGSVPRYDAVVDRVVSMGSARLHDCSICRDKGWPVPSVVEG